MNQLEQPSTQQVSCLLMDGFSSLACAAATDTLIACNRLSESNLYQLEYMGYGKKATSESGQVVQLQLDLSNTSLEESIEQKHFLIVCGGRPANYPDDTVMVRDLKLLKRHYRFFAGIGTGSYCLARAGMLNLKKASVHWGSMRELRAQFPDIFFSTDLFSIDGNIATCRGGSAAQDLMFMLMGQHHGAEMAEALSQYFLKERSGISDHDLQRQSLTEQQGLDQPKLKDAVILMENNIDEPLSTDDIAKQVDLSTRQLERLFKRYLDASPSRYAMLIRLERARKLLQESELSITGIAHACGFSSTAHFSTSYRNIFGLTPSEDRATKK